MVYLKSYDWNRIKKVFLVLVFFVISCSPTVKSFDKYQKAPLLKTTFMPSREEVEGKPIRIAVFPLEMNDIEVAKNVSLGSSMSVDVENVLTKDKLVELVDRKIAKKLKKEVALAELKGDVLYEGPVVANYAIGGSISRADFSSQYVSSRHSFDAEKGKYTYIPPKWNYRAKVGGNIKIYEIPSLKVVETFEFDGRGNKSENAKFRGKAKSRDDFLVKEASRDALRRIEVDLKNFFAKKGYILEKRVLKSKTIFKISLGSDDGIKQGMKLIVYAKKEERNSITNSVEIVNEKLAEGVVSNLINKQSSWIIVKNNKGVNKIRIGDVIQIKYKKGFWRKFGEFNRKMSGVSTGLNNTYSVFGGLVN